MRADIKTFVGLDVHKDSIAIAYANADFGEPPRFLGTTGYSVISLTNALAKLEKPAELSVCHKAGPCGCGLVRSLRHRGYATEVIARSRVARQPADRIKIPLHRQFANLLVQFANPHLIGATLGGSAAKDPGCAFQQLVLPAGQLHHVNLVPRRQLRQRLLTPQNL